MFAYLLEQRRVMFSLCMIVELKKIDVSLADRALRFANPRGCKTMIARVSYVLEKWFKMDFPLNVSHRNLVSSLPSDFKQLINS